MASNQALKLQSCKDSTFENLKLKGPWETNASAGVTTGIWMRALSTAVNCTENYFNNAKIFLGDSGSITIGFLSKFSI